jgi:hypothetical protein
MKQFANDFLSTLPRRIEKLDEQVIQIKRNFVLMSLYLECAGEPNLRTQAYDLVIQDRLLDCHPETITKELPRLVDEAREMLRQSREDELVEAAEGETYIIVNEDGEGVGVIERGVALCK